MKTKPKKKPAKRTGGARPDGKISVLVDFPSSLNAQTRKLVKNFATALANKLAKAEEKYGYSDGWMETEWVESGECERKLLEHAQKGDPRDVAAYCAFLWYHEASTNSNPVLVLPATPEAIEAMVDRAHAAIAADPDYASIAHHQWLDLVHTVLRSAGLLAGEGKGRKNLRKQNRSPEGSA